MSRGLAAGSLVIVMALAVSACASVTPQLSDSSAPPTQPPEPPQPTDVPAEAVVSIASVDVDGAHVTVAGFVTQISEDGGLCRFVLTSGVSGAEVSVETTGIANVETTSCGTTEVATADLAKGPWTVVLEYESEELAATSQPLDLEVP